MTQESRHTELPWQIKNDYMDSHFIIADIDCDDGHYSYKFVAETQESDIIGRANAEFIVRACNSFPKVIDILTKCSKIVDEQLRSEINETLLQMQGNQNA